MKKNKLFLLFLALLLTILSVSGVAQGYIHVAATWGSPCTVADQDERNAMSYTCQYISNLINGRWGWASANYYNTYTTNTMVYAVSDAVKSNSTIDMLATFHVGDMFPQQYVHGTKHYAYYGSDPQRSDLIVDKDLYPHTGTKHYFT